MKLWTYAEIKAKVERDLDLEDETFIVDSEMLDYANEAIDEAEAEIHTIYEDYFLTYDTPALVAGQDYIAMPADIYANKFRKIFFSNGTTRYEIRKMKRLASTNEDWTGETEFQYQITNSTANGLRMTLYPTPAANQAGVIKRWYLRNATRMANAGSICDIPEFTSFVIAKMKALCKQKENGGSPDPGLEALVDKERKRMVDTLTSMVDDEENQVELDTSFYQDFDAGGF